MESPVYETGEEGGSFDELLDSSQESTTPQTVKVGDKEYTLDELSEYVSKGQDYTKKTQQLAEERKTLSEKAQLYDRFLESWETDPHSTLQELERLANQVRPRDTRGRFQAMPEIDPETMTENERALYERTKSLEAALERAGGALEKAEYVAKSVQMDRAAQKAALDIQAEYGIQTNALELLALMDKHGVSDPMKAWKIENFDTVKETAVKAGQVAASKPKPNMGQAADQKIVPFDNWARRNREQWTPDRIMAAMQQGFVFLGNDGKPMNPSQ